MLDVNRGTSSLSGQNAGSPTTHNAHHRARQAPRAPDHRDGDEPDGVLDEEELLRRPEGQVHRPEQHATEPGDEPAHRECGELGAGDTVIADAASSFSRTPMIVRPMPVRRR